MQETRKQFMARMNEKLPLAPINMNEMRRLRRYKLDDEMAKIYAPLFKDREQDEDPK